jgi:hypothetical protein
VATVLKFEDNKAETIALMFTDGKNIIDGYKREQVMFTLADNRIMFVSPDVARRIRLLDVQPHQTFVMKKWRRGRENHWDLWLTPETEKAKAAEEAPGLEALLKDSLVMAEARRNVNAKLEAAGIPAPGPVLVPKVSKQAYGPAYASFLVQAGRATHEAETTLGNEGASVRFDSRDIAAIATTMFIAANERGTLEPGVAA